MDWLSVILILIALWTMIASSFAEYLVLRRIPVTNFSDTAQLDVLHETEDLGSDLPPSAFDEKHAR